MSYACPASPQGGASRRRTAIKHFTAYDPVAKWTVGRAVGKASAASAAALLDNLIAEAPFPIRGVQVDGESEFCAEFGTLCKAQGLDLFVLPPKRPDLNGCVERAQSTWRYEFYGCYDLPTASTSFSPSSTPSPTDLMTTGRTTPLAD